LAASITVHAHPVSATLKPRHEACPAQKIPESSRTMNDSSQPGHHRLGDAALAVSLVHGLSAATTAWARSPMKLLTPRSRGESVWAYTSSFGGGMVAGDRTRLEATVDSGACCFLGTQASTKIYRNPAHLPCSHELIAKIGDDALLILAPDPVQCFADSSYEQRQRFTLSASANLLLIDWMSGGRTARGERWGFRRYLSRNEVERGGRKLLIDALRLGWRTQGQFSQRSLQLPCDGGDIRSATREFRKGDSGSVFHPAD
jgi:urease accessory protein